jgi:hypothetical protein
VARRYDRARTVPPTLRAGRSALAPSAGYASLRLPFSPPHQYPPPLVSPPPASPFTGIPHPPPSPPQTAPAELPPWACSYCNLHTPASVVKCVASGKWFCNFKPPGLPASCIVYHLVR